MPFILREIGANFKQNVVQGVEKAGESARFPSGTERVLKRGRRLAAAEPDAQREESTGIAGELRREGDMA